MPVAGRKPKPAGQAVNRHQPTHDWTEVEDLPFKDGPSLPTKRTNGKQFSARVKKKWDAWRTMPHCILWTDSEWEFALDSIELAAQFNDGDPKVAVELRNRERVLGTTADFRRDLRIRYVDPKPVEVATVHDIDDYRDL